MRNKTLFFYLLLLSLPILGQVDSTVKYPHQKTTFGFDLHEFQNDFGFGLSALSPTFWNEHLKIRAAWSAQWLQFINANNNLTRWGFYQNVRLGIQSRTAIIAEKIYTYGEGGVVFLFPNSSFSSRNFVQGGYGCFGFEIYIQPRFCYYIELGGMGTGAVADKALNQPVYSNGFIVGVGMRLSL